MKKLLLITSLAGIIFCSFHVDTTKTKRRVVNIRLNDTILLPEIYTTRKFISNNAGLDYDGAAIPGNIVKYDSASATYEIETMTAIIKGNKPAIAQKPSTGVIFSGTIPSDSKFNGSLMIDGIKADKGQVIDLEIKDDMIYVVPEGQIDTATIRSVIKDIPANARKSMFYISSATVSKINYKVHDAETAIDRLSKKADKLTKPDTAKKGISVQAKSSNKPAPFKSIGTDTRTITDKVISVQLIPLDNFSAQAKK
jgi:hypothetical protein